MVNSLVIWFIQIEGQMISFVCKMSMLNHQGTVSRPEEELDRLTKKLVYDMNHPPTEEYFGTLAHSCP